MTAPLDFDISLRPDFSLLTVRLQPGQRIHAEPSAMATMDTTIAMTTQMQGGLKKALGRAFGGESLFMNTFTASKGPGEVTFAPGFMGDLQHVPMRGTAMMLQRGGYLAHTDGVEVTAKWEGMRGFFSGEGMVLLKATGEGDLFFSTFGAMLEIDVAGEHYVDTGYVVAFEETLRYEVTTLPGLSRGGKLKTFLFGGEGLVCKFQGSGKLWVQTRAVSSFLNFVNPFRPTKSKS